MTTSIEVDDLMDYLDPSEEPMNPNEQNSNEQRIIMLLKTDVVPLKTVPLKTIDLYEKFLNKLCKLEWVFYPIKYTPDIIHNLIKTGGNFEDFEDQIETYHADISPHYDMWVFSTSEWLLHMNTRPRTIAKLIMLNKIYLNIIQTFIDLKENWGKTQEWIKEHLGSILHVIRTITANHNNISAWMQGDMLQMARIWLDGTMYEVCLTHQIDDNLHQVRIDVEHQGDNKISLKADVVVSHRADIGGQLKCGRVEIKSYTINM